MLKRYCARKIPTPPPKWIHDGAKKYIDNLPGWSVQQIRSTTKRCYITKIMKFFTWWWSYYKRFQLNQFGRRGRIQRQHWPRLFTQRIKPRHWELWMKVIDAEAKANYCRWLEYENRGEKMP